MSNIFISYRRNDAPYVTGHINERLRSAFGDESIFTDVDNVPLGVDFRTYLDEKVRQCEILLAVIGNEWLTAKSKNGDLRLHDPADFVRIEIESALDRDIPVIPLLVDGVEVPSPDDLPETLKRLAFRNAIAIRPAPDFGTDVERLIKSLKHYLDKVDKGDNDLKQRLERGELDDLLHGLMNDVLERHGSGPTSDGTVPPDEKEEDVIFPPAKLWGWIPIHRKPLVVSPGESLTIRGHKIYYSDITSITKPDKWKHDIQYFPVVVTLETGSEYRILLGNYQIDAEPFYDTLLEDWNAIKSARSSSSN